MADRLVSGTKSVSILDMISVNDLTGPEELADLIMKRPVSDLQVGSLPPREVPSLKIDRILLDGFGPHDGPNILEIRDGLTFITGKNGTGKTHIILGVHWCLFGERGSLDPWMSEVDPMGKDLINWKRVGNEDARMKVEVDLTWNDEHYTICRKVQGSSEHFQIIKHEGENDIEPGSLPAGLEPDVLSYLLFQGEAVMFLASEDPFLSEGNLGSVISKLSGAGRIGDLLHRLSGARSILFDRVRELREAAAPRERELSSYNARSSDLEGRIKVSRTKIEELSIQKKKALSLYRKMLHDLSGKNVLNNEDKDEAVARARLPILNEQISEMLGSAGRELLRGMTGEALKTCLEEREDRLRKKMNYGALEAQASILRNISETGKCLCGTVIGRSGMGRERIRSLLTRLETRKDELSVDISEPIWTSDQVLEGVRYCLAAPGTNRAEFIKKIEELDTANSIVDRNFLSGSKNEDRLEGLISMVREMERKSTLLEKEREEMARSIKEKKELISIIRRLERDLLQTWGVQGGETGYSERLEVLDRTIEMMDNRVEELMRSMKKEIEDGANRILSKLDPGSKLGDLRIHDTSFRIGRCFGERGKDRVLPMAYLSAGERELAALSVLSSIPAISGGMLVLDSPFPYIDIERRDRILEGLPDISGRVMISLPEGSMLDDDVEKTRSIWVEKGSSFRHYFLEMGEKGSSLKIERGAER